MELTKLEIKGFKSFGDRTAINFDGGVTGIVGPNGCGKSNIVDAIRWVLGEQKTRLLRSDKMENVIFNGTKSRKATQLAEVSLTFNNTKNLLPTEYSQVSVTRKYYRSGDSEYMINGVPCRLKDINNLFLDTGISSNSYAIIELKMVDDILNDKDNSRRALFEEAAGVLKFKTRKKETLRKLEGADADLERVEDLLFEIDKNLKSLERQAKQAERYFKVKEEYKAQSILLAKISAKKFKNTFINLQKQIEEVSDQKIQLNSSIGELEAGVEKAKAELVSKEKSLSVRQKTLNQHADKIRNHESEKRIKSERLHFLTDSTRNLRERIEHEKRSIERAKFSINDLNKDKSAVQRALKETEASLAELREKHEEEREKLQKIQREIGENNQLFRSEQDEAYQLKKSLEIKDIQLRTLQKELEETTSDRTEKRESLAGFEERLISLTTEVESKKEALENLEQKEETLLARIEDTNQNLDIIKDELNQTRRKLDARENEYNLTKSLVDNLEGFPEAIKFLKKNSQWGKNAPLLSDIISCDEEYRVTIENYLEPYMSHYIVDSEAQAFEAVNLLSDASKGRANFFILDSFEHFENDQTSIFENTIPASEIVDFDVKYRKLVSYILDKVYIVTGDYSDIPEEEGYTFITKNGKFSIKKHIITGGSIGLFEGKRIGRAKNLEKLSKEIKSLNTKIDKISQSLESKHKELNRLKESTKKHKIDALKEDLNKTNEELVSLKTKKEQFEQLLTGHATKREDIIAKSQELESEISALRPKVEEENAKVHDREKALQHLNAEHKLQSDKVSEWASTLNQKNIVLHQQQNRLQSIEQEISYKQNTLESGQEDLQKNQKALEETESEIARLAKQAEMGDDELVDMYAEKEGLEKGVNEAEREYYASRGKIDELEKEARELQKQKESRDTLIMELQNKLNDTKLELSSIKERISVEFNVNLENLFEEEEELPEESVEAIREKVFKLKERLDKMGAINPMAMEAYEEMKERHEFITNQKEDLLNAKNSLLTTIEEIDSVAKDTFLEAFEKIKVNFVKVFRTLFSDEDDCELRLTDRENPLESDIDIIAKPKGKKPLTINQLSGGEKALTATSVLFAIYLLKPAPFCIFDEVDAPLDDANIDKFNQIIREFSQNSQFIIVTHNKRTMASTDIMYGITMVEQGVSKVVPVDLRSLSMN